MEGTDWRFVKKRTADADGAVYVSADGTRYRRTGGDGLRAEAAFQQMIAALGYPVPSVLEHGELGDGQFYVVEESLGGQSMHEMAVESLDGGRELSTPVVDQLAEVSARLLHAQAAHPVLPQPGILRQWTVQAGWTHNVFAENPDFDTPRIHAALTRAMDQLDGVPMCWGHLDYGLPNVLPAGVIDWQHHGVMPLGYDVALALEVIPFKGGAKGYAATPAQRERYLAALDSAARAAGAEPVSPHLGAFLLVKSLFFLALMRPTDPARVDKHQKWQYRRHLFVKGLEQYERTGDIDTALFPTLDGFAAGQGAADRP
ncbi:aminoglycoside phosphotransferase family protein [Streptomyces lunaelactis]|uniref:aminoglycoside phosphotransferase family protein n=1 Tax=Streptomyces lunaelactis TaxID=1535768 RepID=UPI0015852435|nr:aminoglycoside phosphotransferase family protein [Streptomyces lunaelactis]NUK23688.1 aminoglycoside phosphotransferase family protein [Streptomyces lunaelactis]